MNLATFVSSESSVLFYLVIFSQLVLVILWLAYLLSHLLINCHIATVGIFASARGPDSVPFKVWPKQMFLSHH